MKLNFKILYIQVKIPSKLKSKKFARHALKKYPWRSHTKAKHKYSKQKKKRYKTASNLFRDSPHPDPASCDKQSVEFR